MTTTAMQTNTLQSSAQPVSSNQYADGLKAFTFWISNTLYAAYSGRS